MKLAFADVYRYVSDPASMEVTPAQMLDDAYLAARAKLIDPKRAQDFGAGNPVKGGTIYLTAADERGMMVSFIQSNYMGFGSGVVVPGYGVSLQNRGHGFSLRRGQPERGRAGQAAVPHHHPGLPDEGRAAADELRRDGRQHAAAGPPADAGAHARLPPAAAGRLRRAALALQPAACRSTSRRPCRRPPREGLRALGHQIESIHDSYQDFGAGQFIWRLGDPAVEGYVAASDPRRDGQAAAF